MKPACVVSPVPACAENEDIIADVINIDDWTSA